MSRILMGLGCLLLTSHLFAETAGPRPENLRGLSPGDPARKEIELERKSPRMAEDLILFELPAVILPGPHELEASWLVRGKRHFVERLAFDIETMGPGQVIELLAWHPEKRAEILALGRKPKSQVQVSVKLDGEHLRLLPLERLYARTEALAHAGSTPIVTRRVQEDSGALAGLFEKTQAECLDSCYNQYQDCLATCDYGCYYDRVCDRDYDDCQARCPPDCTGPTVREYTLRINQWARWVTWNCYDNRWYPYSPILYDKNEVYDKLETHRETTQCDGTKTNEVIAVNYETYYCWDPRYVSCSPSWGSSLTLRICN
jgi:hypothetical protein